MSKIVSTKYSPIYFSQTNRPRILVGCFAEALSDTHQCLGMLSLPELSDEILAVTPKVLLLILDEGLPNLLKETLFNEAWAKAPKGDCLSYLSRAHQGAVLVEQPVTLSVADEDVDIETHVISTLKSGWDFQYESTFDSKKFA